ncbi:WGR domain-containing protein [Myxosarcina sp. GI1(2024)]
MAIFLDQIKMYALNRWKTRRWIKENRHYTACLQQDLFGSWTVTKAWGSHRSGHGRSQVIAVASYEAGVAQLNKIAARRLKRSYAEAEA